MAEGLSRDGEKSKFFGEGKTLPDGKGRLLPSKSVIRSLPNVREESLGGWSGSGTPGHIPNPVVKPASADGTRRATYRESRSSPKDSFSI